MAKHETAWLNEETGEIHTPRARMVYPQLLEAKRIKDKPDSKPKFSVTLLLPKTANIDIIKTGLVAVLTEKFGKDWAKNKKLLYPLLKTMDQERLVEYAEDYPFILRCSANEGFPPFVYGPDAQPFKGDASQIYNGRWAVVAGKFYAYDNVSKGANFGLNRIQLLDHDDPIAGGRIATASGFESVGNVGGTEFDVSGGDKKAAPISADKVFDDVIPF